jgi:hypothetical protein
MPWLQALRCSFDASSAVKASQLEPAELLRPNMHEPPSISNIVETENSPASILKL